MLNLDNFAITLGRALEAFRRGPDAVPEQKVALRALVALLRLDGAVVRAEHGELLVGDAHMSPALPGVRTLLVQCEGHDVEEIRLRQGVSPASLLHLLRALATPIGRFPIDEDVVSRLAAAGVEDVAVRLAHQRPPAVPAAAPPAGGAEPTERVSLAAAVARAPRLSRPETTVAAMVLEPADADLSGRLATAIDHIGEELVHGRPSGAIRAASQLIHLEETAADPERQRTLQQAVGRLVDTPLLEGALACARDEGTREAALRVLHRGGPRGVALARDRLLAAERREELVELFGVLRALPGGVRGLVLQLQAPAPRTVERAARSLGVLGVHEAAPVLARIAVHPDAGVRAAAAAALVALATPDAIEGLQALLADPDRELRAVAVRALRGAGVAALTGRIEELARSERDDPLLVEAGRALGRIGTPEAVAVLVRWAAAPGWRFWRRHVGLRLAAVEGLRAARGPGAVQVLRGLVEDGDADVRRAAAEALEDVSIAARASAP